MVPDPVFLSRSGSGFQISLDPDPDPVQHPDSNTNTPKSITGIPKIDNLYL